MNKELRALVNDIMKYLRGEDNDFEMNQVKLRIKYAFRGIIIWSEMGTNFSISKYTDMNRIINKYHMNFYYLY